MARREHGNTAASAYVIPHLAHEQDAALSIYSAGERYVSSSPHAAAVRSLVGASVLNGEGASPTNPSLGPAGADVPESDSPEHVASVSLPVVASERDPSYRDDVQHTRQSRLSRWQEQR